MAKSNHYNGKQEKHPDCPGYFIGINHNILDQLSTNWKNSNENTNFNNASDNKHQFNSSNMRRRYYERRRGWNHGKWCLLEYRPGAEWTTLTTFLDGESVAGGKLKEEGTTNWLTPNSGTDNSSSFSALPGGNRAFKSDFAGFTGGWWSSTKDISNFILYRKMRWDNPDVEKSGVIFPGGAGNGLSVRCIQD